MHVVNILQGCVCDFKEERLLPAEGMVAKAGGKDSV